MRLRRQRHRFVFFPVSRHGVTSWEDSGPILPEKLHGIAEFGMDYPRISRGPRIHRPTRGRRIGDLGRDWVQTPITEYHFKSAADYVGVRRGEFENQGEVHKILDASIHPIPPGERESMDFLGKLLN